MAKHCAKCGADLGKTLFLAFLNWAKGDKDFLSGPCYCEAVENHEHVWEEVTHG